MAPEEAKQTLENCIDSLIDNGYSVKPYFEDGEEGLEIFTVNPDPKPYKPKIKVTA